MGYGRKPLANRHLLLEEAVGEMGLHLATGGRLFISRNKATRLHELVWIVPNEQIEPGSRLASPTTNVSVKDLDSLFRASNSEQFIRAISGLRPQFWRAEDLSRLGRRFLSSEQFAKQYETTMELPDAEMLRRETVLVPFAVEWACSVEKSELAFSPSTNKKAAERIIEKTAVGGELIDFLGSAAGTRYSVLTEPLQEWLFTRNLLWIAATLYPLSRKISGLGNEEALAEIEKRSIFRVVPENAILKKRCLVVPFIFNPYYRTESMAKRLADSVRRADAMVNPLRTVVTEIPSELQGAKGLFGLHYYTSLKHCESALLMTKKQAFEPIPSEPANMTVECKLECETFECIAVTSLECETPERTRRLDGLVASMPSRKAESAKRRRKRSVRRSDDEFEFVVIPIDETKAIVEVLSDVIQGIHYGFAAGPSGSWECALGAELSDKKEEHGMSILGFNSIPAALWETLTHHQGYSFVVCENCRNTVLVSTRGAKSKYCSNSCRSAASRKRKERGELEAGNVELIPISAIENKTTV